MWKSLGILSVIVLTTIFEGESRAIPLFARRYNVTCFTCHISEPLLNDFGKRFRFNGFELPGAGADRTPLEEKDIFPLAILAQPQVAHVRADDNFNTKPATSTTVVKEVELEIFSEASLGPHLSYFTELGVAVAGDETAIDIGSLYVLYTDVLNDGSGNLNFRGGKMLFMLPSFPISLLAGSTPLVYEDQALRESVTGAKDLRLGETMFAVSAFGQLPQLLDGLYWEVAFTGGSRNEVDLGTTRAFYASVNQAVDLGNSALQLGAFYFGGRQFITIEDYQLYPRNNTSFRAGVDLEFSEPWMRRLQVYGQFITGKDDNIDYWRTRREVNGGFVGVHAIVLPEKLYAFARYDRLKADELEEITTDQIDLGLRYHFVPNVVLTGGYTRREAHHQRTIGRILQQSDQNSTTFYLGILLGY